MNCCRCNRRCCNRCRLENLIRRIINEIGGSGADGKDGLTPHIGDNGNWFIGDIDTGISAQGTAGIDGLSAYEIAVENGFTGTISEWLESLIGPQGEPGTADLIALQMQSQNNQNLILSDNVQRVPFDTIIFDNSDGSITYDSTSDMFTITKAGLYRIDYSVSYATNYSGIFFSISYGELGDPQTSYIVSASTDTSGELSGFGIIECTNNLVVTINTSTPDTSLANVMVQANIVIQQIK